MNDPETKESEDEVFKIAKEMFIRYTTNPDGDARAYSMRNAKQTALECLHAAKIFTETYKESLK